MAPASALSPLLAHANTIVQGIAKDTAKEATEDAVQQLKSVVFAITSAGRHHRNLSPDEQTAVWELVCLLWVSACCGSSKATAATQNLKLLLQGAFAHVHGITLGTAAAAWLVFKLVARRKGTAVVNLALKLSA